MRPQICFLWSAPVAFRRVALETPEWTSRDSNNHRQSVSAGKTNAIPTEPSGRLPKMRPQKRKIHSKGRPLQQTKNYIFFSSSLADVALRLGPYMSISCRKDVCTRTQLVHMSRQIEVKKPKTTQDHQTTTTRKSPSQTCVSPEETAKQTTTNRHKQQQKRGRSPNKTPTKSICQGTQWLDHCISLKNMRQK